MEDKLLLKKTKKDILIIDKECLLDACGYLSNHVYKEKEMFEIE